MNEEEEKWKAKRNDEMRAKRNDAMKAKVFGISFLLFLLGFAMLPDELVAARSIIFIGGFGLMILAVLNH